jgi:D-3-phosphoglycerate dehydrogenase
MQILVACELPAVTIDGLRSLGSKVTYLPAAAPQELRDAIVDAGLLIVEHARVGAELLGRARKLQMIVRAGPGPGEIALEDASAQGIFVSHCPTRHAAATAELVFGLILALDRRIVENTTALREGRWARHEFADARGLAGRTIGLLGFDSIGRLIAQRAWAFQMDVVAWSPTLLPASDADGRVEFCNYPRELARRSDVIVVLEAASDEDSGVLVDSEFLSAMRHGAYFVHVGRPGVVDEAALTEAATERDLRVALDTFAAEPVGDQARFRTPLVDLPGFVGTERMAAVTDQAREATGAEILHIVRSFVVSSEVVNCLNLCDRSPATWQLLLRVRDQVGVMASILEAIRADGINAEEISSRVFLGAHAAWCTIALDERPSAEALEAIRGLPEVLHLELRAVV